MRDLALIIIAVLTLIGLAAWSLVTKTGERGQDIIRSAHEKQIRAVEESIQKKTRRSDEEYIVW